MSDFDFDELDRAVAGVAQADPAEPVSAVEQADLPVITQESPIVKPRIAPRPAPATRRNGGRFMDVVHPSSDMRSRNAPAIVEPTTSNAETVSFVPPTVKPEEPVQSSSNDIEQAVSMPDQPAVGAWSQQPETPFLSDAKVEKRPLGGVGPEPTQELLETPEAVLLIEETSLPDPIDFAAHIAALKSETEDTGTPYSVDEVPEEQEIEQLDELQEPGPVASSIVEVAPSEDPTVVTPNEEPIGPASISQQYTEQPSEQQASGAIFDTENYHQPLTTVAKKRSGVWTVLGILLLVALGAGAGVAFYVFVLPML